MPRALRRSYETLRSNPSAENDRLAPIRRKTLTNQGYAELRKALLTGRFEPGSQMTVKYLAERLSCGVMPVREAVQRLVAEGALQNLPNGRAAVPVFTPEEFDEIIIIRRLLEPLAVRRASATPALADELERLQAELTRAADELAPEDGLWLNYQFHFTLYRASASHHLVSLIEAVWLRFGPMIVHAFRSGGGQEDYIARQLKLHSEICQSIRSKDTDSAEQVVLQIIDLTHQWFHCTYAFDKR